RKDRQGSPRACDGKARRAHGCGSRAPGRKGRHFQVSHDSHAAILDQRSTRRPPSAATISFLMAEACRWIAIVDDDPFVLKGLRRLLRARSLHAKTYGSAQ